MKPHILLIDDDPVVNFVNSKIVASVLKDMRMSIYQNASDAHKSISSRPQERYVIFLDLNMPEMNGWEFLDQLNLLQELTNAQVVILTSSVDRRDKERSRKYPVVKAFISKPLKKKELESVCEMLGLR